MQSYHLAHSIVLEATSHDELAAWLRRYYPRYIFEERERGYDVFMTDDLESPQVCLFEFA